MKALGLLSLCKLKNSLRTMLTDPRKLIPLLIILAFVGFAILMSSLQTGKPPRFSGKNLLDPSYMHVAAVVAMAVIAVVALSNSLSDSMLAFAPPDVDYLFPSPISRKMILALKMPALLLGTVIQGLVFSYLVQSVAAAIQVEPGQSSPPGGSGTLAVTLCVGIYMNLALFVAMHLSDRRKVRVALWTVVGALAGVVGGLWWLRGFDAVHGFVSADAFRAIFYPAALAGDVVFATVSHRPLGDQFQWLWLMFVLSLIPPFLGNTNWYEQSIVSTERFAAFRTAAKGGSAELMALKSASYRHKATKTYIVKPFGQGAWALVWAHLSAAAKRPYANFVAAGLLGFGLASVGALIPDRKVGPVFAAAVMLYSTFAFMAAAKTASEAAIRRRELLAPLPLRGWETVAANLAVPVASVFVQVLAFAVTYTVLQGEYWPYMLFGALVVFPLRLLARMVLQYGVVLANPDIADKVQQFFSSMMYFLFAAPFLVGEVLVCLPAFFLGSPWLALGTLAVYEAGLLVFLLILTGKAAERAVASGEPVSLARMVVGK